MFNPDPLTVGQLWRAGAGLRAARLIKRGLDDDFIRSSLEREFGPQNPRVLLEVVRLAHQAYQAAQVAQNLKDGQTFDASIVPLIPK
jgi:hypothetical protein